MILRDPDRCAICGETITEDQEAAEMHSPLLHDRELCGEAEAGVVHAECGLQKGWLVS